MFVLFIAFPILLFSQEFNTAEFPEGFGRSSQPTQNYVVDIPSEQPTVIETVGTIEKIQITNISTNAVTNITLNRQIITVTNIIPETLKTFESNYITNVVTNTRQYAPLNSPGQTPEETFQFLEAVKTGDLIQLKLLLQNGVSPNTHIFNEQSGIASTAVMIATSERRINVLEMLLRYGADPNLGVTVAGIQNITPIMMAARRGPVEAIDLLLDYGANINARTDGAVVGNTALVAAIGVENTIIVEYLLSKGADPNLPTRSKYLSNVSPLMLAVEKGNKSIANILLHHPLIRKTDVDSQGKNALVYAYITQNLHLVQDLIESGIRTDLNDQEIKKLTRTYKKNQ